MISPSADTSLDDSMALSASTAEPSLHNLALPRYDSLPSFGIYVDQLVSFVNDTVGFFAMPDEKPVTAAMVNNYVKQGVMPRPIKKKYGRNHIAYVIVICILKKVFSIQEINQLIQLQKSLYDSGPAYDAFIESLEKDLAQLFGGVAGAGGKDAAPVDRELLVQRGVSTFSNKLFIQMTLGSMPGEADKAESSAKKAKRKN
ncbi:MAG: DUF1836 domain-containing protein [Coriobacteriia bacterium]|nr:DUF1836 domain-containing protein [Coriobacteriia bacterium]MCL2749832.1 DUF1836 domain-containing protein [Coriobacteriia bacterium]